MRILLVRPQVTLAVAKSFQAFLRLEPLDLEIVAAGIERKHETRILDLSLSADPQQTLAATMQAFAPDVVGFGGYTNQAGNIKRLAALAKQCRPTVKVLVGGVHATIVPDDFRLPDIIDLVVRGEGATAMRELIPLLENNSPLPACDRFLPTASAAFASWAATPPPSLPDYDQIPWPRRDLIERGRYYCIWGGQRKERLATLFPRVATLRTSTGCPHRCRFCVVHHLAHGKYHQRDPEDVVNEIATLKEDHIYFVDDEMFINAQRAETMARLLLERGIRKRYMSWVRSDTICRHRELFQLWKQAGLDTLFVGLESMEDKNLNAYHKGYAPDVNRRAIQILRDLDITLHAALMVNPDFEASDFIKLRAEMKAIAPAEFSFTVFSPPPGTPLWDEHKEQLIASDPYAFYDCMHTLLPTKMPLKNFYRAFSLLYLFGFRYNPGRARHVKIPLKDWGRLFVYGFRCGRALRTIYKDYEKARW